MKKLLVHIGAHKTGTTALQRQLYSKYPELFDDRTAFKASSFMQAYEDYKIELDADELADLFQDALIKPDANTYRLSHERFMGKTFSNKQFYPYLKRYAQLVQVLMKRGVKVKTLVTVRNRTDFLVSYFLQCLSWPSSSKNFHDFANRAVTPAFSWQSVASQLEGISVTYLPYEAMEKNPSDYVDCINKFYEQKLLSAEDIKSRINTGLNEMGLSVIPQLSVIEDKGLRTALLDCALAYCKQGERATVLSEHVEKIYREYFREGDIAFAKAYFPSQFRRIYIEQPAASEQFWFPFAKVNAST